MTAGAPTIGGLKRLSSYMAGQLASAVSITGGTINAAFRDQNVVTESTATALANNGVSLVSSTAAKTYSIAAPVAGVYKFIRNTAGSSSVLYTGSSLISIGSNSTITRITLAGVDAAVILKGESATKWGIYGAWQSSLVTVSS